MFSISPSETGELNWNSFTLHQRDHSVWELDLILFKVYSLVFHPAQISSVELPAILSTHPSTPVLITSITVSTQLVQVT